MKLRTSSRVKNIGKCTGVLIITWLLYSLAVINTASANNLLDTLLTDASACSTGYADIWIVTRTCDIGSSTDIKVDDAIHIQCDTATSQWSVDFYAEPAGADPNIITSDAIRYPICPGNGYLELNEAGNLVMRCNFWEAQDNLVKQLEFEMDKITEQGYSGERTMQWKVIERDNPNVVCGTSGRPDNGSDTGGSRTIADE